MQPVHSTPTREFFIPSPPLPSCLSQGEFSVPYAAHDICNQREKLREQREHVMLVVRAYNSERGGVGGGMAVSSLRYPSSKRHKKGHYCCRAVASRPVG